MVWSATLGLPRMGPRRELKRALEAYWSGKATEDHLQEIAKQLRARRWRLQQAAGID
ncbi:MAG: hypothetical protein K6T63_11810, partial [Alicyclobacillus herbarius]|uniref:hypothetical protein n=1 Tax=Alicyclobacillus herbarius TaxID=122960 RepID=UPI0023568940